ncbi:hypothetical protein ABVT39_025502 [Epinephelus coioides]
MERENVTDPDAIIAVLKEQLDVSRNNEESLIKKLKQFRQRIADVAKVEKELSTEKTLREQKESELRRFRNVESVNKKLTLEVQTLQHKVTVLTGKNTSASKRLEQQKQQLKDKDTEQEKMRDYFQKLMDESKYYKEEVKKLALDKDHVDKLKRKSAELRKEIEEEKNLNKIHQDNIGCFKRQITNLESDKRDLELSQEEMGSQMDDMRKDMDALKSEIETHKNEAFKQKNLISKLQSDTLISKKVRRKLAKKVDETKQRVKDQDQIITDLKTEIRDNKDEQTETQIQITILKNERDLTLENLSKAQREVGLLKSTIEKQQQDILAMTLDQNKVGTELDQVKKDYDSARKQLIEVSKKLEQTQVLLGRHKDKVKQDVKLEEKRYMVIVAEKEGLERELQHSMHQVSQQRHTITVQKAAKEALEQTVKSLRQEVESLTLQNCEAGTKNSTLTKAFNKLKLQKAVFLPADKWRIYSSTHLQCKYRQFFRHERCVQRQAALVETQRKEIEELKLALARRPDDVVQKLAKCQWDNRELKKQLMAFKGEKIVYEGSYQRVKEENRKLSEALSDVKVEAWRKRKAAPRRSIRMERENVTDPDAIIAVLREQLDASRNNEESLIKKLKQFQQRIADVAKVEKELSTEKTLREQKESELRRFRNIESVNMKLTLEVQTLQHEVTVLTGKNTSASKRLEQQKQQLKDKDTEQEKMRDYFQKLMNESKYYKEEVKKLALDKDHVDKLKRKSKIKLRKEIEEEKNLNKIHQDNIGCFKRQITNLESDKRDLELSQKEMGSQMDKMRKDMDALKSEIETHKNEAFKQNNLISKLQCDTLISKKVKRKLEKKVDETKQRVKDQDQIITDLKTEIRNNKDEQTKTQIQITVLKNERDLTLENLSKAQREIGLLKSTIEKQQQDILAMTLDQNKVGTELDQVKKDYDSARKQLIEVSKKLEQTQVLLGRHKDKVKQDVKLEEKRYMVIVAEKEGLERELQHSMHQVSQQCHTITVQKAAKEALEQTVKSLRQEVESLTLQNCEAGTKNSTLTKAFNKLKLQKAVFLPADKWRIYSSTHLQCKYRQFFRHERCVQRQAALVETQRKEIEELKLALARRPDDVVQKLVKCQWDNRELKKQLMAFKGQKIAYEGSYQRERKENRKLSEALSDVKVEAWRKRKAASRRSIRMERENVTDPDAIIAVLREQLDASRNNEESLIKKLKQFQQRIADVAKVEKELSTEKTLREQKESELRRFRNIESVNMKLTLEVQTLQHEVTVLTGKNTSASKRLEQQKQQLKDKDTEQEKMRDYFQKLMNESKYYKEEVKKLALDKDHVDKLKRKSKIKLRKEIEEEKNLNKIHQDNIGCFKRQITNLESDKRDLELSQKEMGSQMDKMRKDMDALKSEIETHKNEAFKQNNLISKLQCDTLISKKVKRKLEKKVDETKQRVKDQDQIITDLKTEIRNNKDEQTKTQIQITVLKNERDLTLENLSKAQREIGLLKSTIEKQQQDILAMTLDQNKVGTELDQVKKDYDSARKQLIEVSKKLEQTQVLLGRHKDKVKQDVKLEEKRYMVIVAEKEGLERELQHSMHQVSQQCHTITVQKAAKEALEQTVKSLRQEVESLTLQNCEAGTKNSTLTKAFNKLKLQKAVFLPADKWRIYSSTHLQCSIRMERENVTDPDAIIAVLREQLDASRNNEESLIKKLKQFQQRIADVAKVEKELSTEKTLREQKESELRRFRNIESVNMKLTLEVQTLQHEVTVLTGKNTSASKRLEQQKQQLKDKDTEQEKMRDYFQKLMNESKYYKEEVKKLALDKDHVDKLKRKSKIKLRKEIEEEKNLNKIHQDNIGCFKRQITNLESDKRDLELSQKEMGSQMDKMRKDMDALKSEIETHKNEAFKQNNLISKLQCDTLISKKVKRKLEKKVDETKQRVKDQDQIITDLKTEIRNNKDEQTKTQIQITVLKNERDLTLENLSKAQREIGLLKSTIEKQQQDILAMTLDQNKVGTELDQVKKDYDSARKQLIEVSKKLEQTQVLLGRHKDKVKQDVKLEEKRYMVIVAEKEGLERELQHSMHQVSQQCHTITVQKAAKEALEQTVKSLRQEVESLTLQNCEAGTKNSTLTKAFNKLKLQKAVFLPADKWRIYSSTHLQCKYRQFFRHERCVQRQAALVETQRKEIEELKLALARRPDDVVQKLVKCQWDNRELKKQLMAFKGQKIAYEGSYQRERKENRKLSEALSDVKVEAWRKRKAASRREPQQPLRQTRFALSADRTPSQSEDRSSHVPVMRPLTRTIQLCVGRFMPRPPPPSTQQCTPDLRLPELAIRELLPSPPPLQDKLTTYTQFTPWMALTVVAH